MSRPEIDARDGIYPMTDAGKAAIERFTDTLDRLVPDIRERCLLLHAHICCLIEQHNASWDAAMVERITTPVEHTPKHPPEPPYGS